MAIPLESLENLPVATKRKLIERLPEPTKDPRDYLIKLKHVLDAGKDYKVLTSHSCR